MARGRKTKTHPMSEQPILAKRKQKPSTRQPINGRIQDPSFMAPAKGKSPTGGIRLESKDHNEIPSGGTVIRRRPTAPKEEKNKKPVYLSQSAKVSASQLPKPCVSGGHARENRKPPRKPGKKENQTGEGG